MKSRMLLGALLGTAALVGLSCSKTQDTAPERRVFGDPPTIVNVDPNFFTPQSHIECDWTELVKDELCFQGGLPRDQIVFVAGPGWTPGNPANPNPSTVAGVFVDGFYGEVSFKVRVTDPNSTSGSNNILLVSASFVDPPPSTTERTLVIFDDGSSNKFPNPQQQSAIGEDCSVDEFGTCSCASKTYNVESGDVTASDGTFTRNISFTPPNINPFLEDCIMRDRHENVLKIDAGKPLSFKIEAVDRQGNLVTWPTRLSITTTPNSFFCNGDPCACCLIQHGVGLSRDCNDLPGLIVTGTYDTGTCIENPQP